MTRACNIHPSSNDDSSAVWHVVLHEVQCITAVCCRAAEEEQVSPHHPPCVYHRITVQQSTTEKPIHQPTIPPCMDNNSTAVQQKKKRKHRDREIQLTLCLSRIERSTVEPTEYVVITCRLQVGNFETSSTAEFGCDARSFAGDREGCCMGGNWRGCAVSGDWLAPGNSRC